MKRITALAACLLLDAPAPPDAIEVGPYGAGRADDVWPVNGLPDVKSLDVVCSRQGAVGVR